MGKRRGVYQRRPMRPAPAEVVGEGGPYENSEYMQHLKVVRNPETKKKVAHKKKAPGGSPIGGNVSSNAAGAHPGV
jgi:hypothetical protein